MNANDLRAAIHAAFDYTDDNNRDLLGDSVFSTAEVMEEIAVKAAKDFLSAYIARNSEMIDSHLKDEEL